MADSRDAIEEIRNRINILDVVSEYVAIKRAGKSHKGLCPFHSEKTPSFTVSEEFQTWHCFGCGEHGDAFSFLMKIENLTFAETLERLAKRTGVQLEQYQGRQTSRRELLAKINSLAAGYYSELLKRTPVALQYLQERGVATETIEQFRLGYAAPAWDGLIRYITGKGVNLADATQAGLVIQGDRGSYYDRFRHRIIFPILDIQERIIGFGGRAFGDDQPKYLNSPETPLFNKTKSLYGLNLARKNISENDRAIVVEGYMDVITAYQAGFTNCVATLGTALTLEHINVLSRYTKRVALAYDADSAGMTAAMRGASMFDAADCDVRIVRLPAGDDPDSLLRQGRSAEFSAAISDALPIVDYKLAVLQERYDLSNPEGRTAMLKEAVRMLADVPTSVEREKYIKSLARHHPNFESGTTRAEEHLRRDIEALVRRRQGVGGPRQAVVTAPKPKSALEKAQDAVLRLLLHGGAEAEAILDALTPEDFSEGVRRDAAKVAFEIFREKKGIYLPEVLETADGDVGRFVSELAMRNDGPPVGEEDLKAFIDLMKRSKLRNLRTSDILAPYIKRGIIDPTILPSERRLEEFEAFLRESGKLPGDDE